MSYFQDDDDDEQEKLLETHPPPPVYSPGTVGVPSTILEPPNVYKSRWRSIRVMYLTMFLSSVSFSICMSSIWPYLQLLDPSATTDFLGWVVASYSLGQLIASPIFGFWANKRKRSREPLVVSIVINILATVLYAYLESLKSHKSIALLLARGFIGFGAGNVAVVRSYVSGATTTRERTGAMASMSACQAIGFIFGPGIQTAMVPVGWPGPVHEPGFHLDLYTMPAWLSVIVGIMNVVLLVVVFQEHRVDNDEDINFQVQVGERLPDYTPDTLAVIASLILFFFVLFLFVVFETIATPLTMDMFSWTKSEATLYTGIILAVGGVIAIFVFIVVKVLVKRFNERYILIGGFLFCLAGFITFLPWGNDFPDYHDQDLLPPSSVNSTTDPLRGITDWSTSLMTTPGHNSSAPGDDPEHRGCPISYKWCAYTPRILLPQFLGGTLLIVIGYPVCNLMIYTIFSKVLGPKPQGVMMGLLTGSGSLARTLGPIFISQVYNAYGPRVTFACTSVIVLFAICGCVSVFKRLVPFQYKRKDSKYVYDNS
ncbi:major facilitator superfamily domain-containing protein 8-like [Mizuhopecten yessoensis]|uniref:Major facilitator superfamily domain-containing protein 8 n=1 Tax=Mizuhopecten yessoensis TaxID=6573 RepID=A0A210PPS0_MIZYE|nr:major facilitator superfamily domain-containing protein 8-like [Mizuhopecten yessoensis]OWF38500.1 Major facilitator superfamily domain-containing protein 8 [Mizuhopecten yessoensis]